MDLQSRHYLAALAGAHDSGSTGDHLTQPVVGQSRRAARRTAARRARSEDALDNFGGVI